MKRDSSPPEAIRVSGPNGASGIGRDLELDSIRARRASLGPDDCGAKLRGFELQGCQLSGNRRVEPAAASSRCA